MNVIETELPGVLIIEPDRFGDDRGFFMESWNLRRYREIGISSPFVQSNLSQSERGVVRGLHFQNPHPQGKLVQVLSGEVFDVAVDIRSDSPTFAQWVSVSLDAGSSRQLYIPPGFAHGFCVTSETALFTYFCSTPYEPQHDAAIAWDDPDIGVVWPIAQPRLSSKDAAAPRLIEFDAAKLIFS